MYRLHLFVLLATMACCGAAQAQTGDPGRYIKNRHFAYWLQGFKAPGRAANRGQQEKPAPLLLYKRQTPDLHPLQRLLNWDCRVMLRLNQNLYFVVRYS